MSKQPIIGRHRASDDQFVREETDGDLPVSKSADYAESKEKDLLLRPKRMLDMVGQREVFERLLIAIEAAKIRKEPLGHILFDGPPGLGKTTFATCIHHELGVPLQTGNGATLRAPKDVLPYLINAKEGSILFIDEIHRMQKTVEEFLYPAMEDFRVDMTMGEGAGARTLNIPLERFTLIGATTRTGLISAPLRDRFTIHEHLGFYSVEELAEIVRRNAEKLNVYIDTAGAFEIATRSRGTPRLANNRLWWVRDYATIRSDGRISLEVARRALEMQGVDELGLDSQDRQYMETLIGVFDGGPAGVEAIAHTINVAPDTLVDEVEPFLLRSQLIIRSPRGRRITAKGLIHLGYDPGRFDLAGSYTPDTSAGQPSLFD